MSVNDSRLMYWMRTVPTELIMPTCREYDRLVRNSFLRIVGLNTEIDGFDVDQLMRHISLPKRNGGFGLRQAAIHAPAAYLGSLSATSALGGGGDLEQHVIGALAIINQLVDVSHQIATPSALRAEDADNRSQRSLSSNISKRQFSSVMCALDVDARKNLLSMAHPNATAYIFPVTPHWADHNPDAVVLRGQDYRRAIQVHLNMHVFSLLPNEPVNHDQLRCGQCPFNNGLNQQCAANVDARGRHVLALCNRHFWGRHQNMRDTLVVLARRGGLGAAPDVNILPFTNLKPADALIAGDHAIDVSFATCHSARDDFRYDAVSMRMRGEITAPIRTRETNKKDKYGPLCQDMQYKFTPVVFGSAGITGKSAKDFIESLLVTGLSSKMVCTRTRARNWAYGHIWARHQLFQTRLLLRTAALLQFRHN